MTMVIVNAASDDVVVFKKRYIHVQLYGKWYTLKVMSFVSELYLQCIIDFVEPKKFVDMECIKDDPILDEFAPGCQRMLAIFLRDLGEVLNLYFMVLLMYDC